jgi:glucan biosynthesis protein C
MSAGAAQTLPDPAVTARLYYVDWLRIGAVLLLIPFHTARVFNADEDWYIKNRQLSRALAVFVEFVSPWHMSLLFLLAGCGTWLAMRHRSGRQYAGERFKRLLVPFIFGLVIIVPPQSWLGFITHGHAYQSFWSYYPQFWTTVDADITGYAGGFTPGHLWFILFLWLLALLALPLFLWLRNRGGRRVVDWVGRGSASRAAPLFLMLPSLGLMFAWAVALETDVLVLSGQNPIGYFLLLVFGFMLVADERILAAIGRHWVWMLPAGLAGVAIMVCFWQGVLPWSEGHPDLQDYLVNVVLRCLAVWATMVGFIGMAQRLWNKRGRLWAYSAEAAYPFYIWHQTVIVAIAYFVVQMSWPVAAKWVLLMVASLSATLLAYDLLVRRWDPVRFLFGMKPRRRGRAPCAAAAEPAEQPTSASAR